MMIDQATTYETLNNASDGYTLQRGINWTGAFWVASGVPALVLFSIGAIASTVEILPGVFGVSLYF